MFWLIFGIIVVGIFFVAGIATEGPKSAFLLGALVSLAWVSVIVPIGHVLTEPKVSVESIELVNNTLIELDECYQRKNSDGSINVLVPVERNKERAFIIPVNLPEFEEIGNASQDNYFVVKSDKYTEVVLQTYRFKTTFFFVSKYSPSIYVLMIPVNYETAEGGN